MMLSTDDAGTVPGVEPQLYVPGDDNGTEGLSRAGEDAAAKAGGGSAGVASEGDAADGGEISSGRLRRNTFDVSVNELLWSGASVTAGDVSKAYNWKSKDDGTAYRTVLRHDTFTGNLSLSVNGVEKMSNVMAASMLNVGGVVQRYSDRLPFTVGNYQGQLHLRVIVNEWIPVPARFEYALVIDGEAVADESLESTGKGVANGDFKVWVTSAENTGDGVTWYRVDSKRSSTGMEVAVHRRFSDFHNLAIMVATYYKGSQLLQILPTPPPKGLKFFQNHFDPQFIEDRRVGCETFLRKLLTVPRVSGIGEVHDFLGHAGQGLRETSVVFLPGPLGLKMAKQGQAGASRAGIADFNQANGGEAGPAERSGRLYIGDCVSRVAGESIAGMGYQAIIDMITQAPRPTVIHFLGYEIKTTKVDQEKS